MYALVRSSLMALTAAEIADIRRYAQELADQAPPLTPNVARVAEDRL
jgi:hypothetical protein